MNQLDVLKELLGAESGNTWVEFMDYVEAELSHVLKRGKPRSEDIENSIIGRSGFNSWAEMVETASAEGGLGWNLAAWDSWKRAYKLVQQHPYLRDLELTASAINTAHRETKPNFPADLEAWNNRLVEREQLQLERQQNSLSDAKKMVEQLKKEKAHTQYQLGISSQRLGACEEELRTTKNTITMQAEQLGELKTKLTMQAEQLNVLKAKLAIAEPAAEKVAFITKQNRLIEIREAKLKKEIDELKNRGLLARILNKRRF